MIKTKFLYVQPKTEEASANFETLMYKLHSCKALVEKNDSVLLSSITGKYTFWFNKENDPNWTLIK